MRDTLDCHGWRRALEGYAMLSWLALGSLLWCSSSEAALNLMRTRVIYKGGNEASLMVRNDGSEPSLLQAWREGGVLPPYGSLSLPMAGAVPAGACGRLRWIDDDGNYHEQEFVLSRHVGERDE
ncbi:MAG: hypothetical protein ACK4E9_03130 [Aeromonas media]|uniref:hypothetical protein n=1 Tax=Aeromonas media TaxID=651 RepID=UPI0035AE40F6